MFIGHFAAGFAGRRLTPRVSLGTWILAVQWLDLLWPVLLLAGLEHVRIDPGNTPVTPLDFYDYPFSHSLLWVAGWSVAFGLTHWLRRRDRVAAALLAAGVASHWILDFVSHGPDLPASPSGPYLGLGLWRSVAATALVESAIFAGAVAWYSRATRPVDRTGRYAWWALVAFLYVIYLGPPPPDVSALAYTALAAWLFVAWGYWIGSHRAGRSDVESTRPVAHV